MSEHEIEIRDELTEFLLYTTPSHGVRVEIFLHDETVWLTQKRLADLFGVDRSVVTKHLKNIFDSGELVKESVCAKIAHTAESEYDEFNKTQKIESDFDRFARQIEMENEK